MDTENHYKYSVEQENKQVQLINEKIANYFFLNSQISRESLSESLWKNLEKSFQQDTAVLIAHNEILKRDNLWQKFLLKLSNQFINLPGDRFDETIDGSLENLAVYLNSNCVGLFQLQELTLTYTHGWQSAKLEKKITKGKSITINPDNFILKKLNNLVGFTINSQEDLPLNLTSLSSDRQQIFLFIPLVRDYKLTGFLIFLVTEKNWQREINYLELAADIFTKAIERQQQEKSLHQQIRCLEESNEQLENFAAIAAHDLREPIRKIKNFTEFLQEDYQGKLDEQADKYLSYIHSGAVRLQSLIKNILNYSRVTKNNFNFQWVNLNQLVEQVIFDLEPMIQETQTEIQINHLPNALVDYQQITRVWQNLLTNSLKFSRTTPLKINIDARLENSAWLITIQDNGMGIAAQDCEKIFQLFHRGDNQNRADGSGIGLAICRKIIERHGGKIWVESEPDRGSTFYFTLPLNN